MSKVITRLDASIAKGLTRFLGRKREMEVLREAFDYARTGTGQIIGIVGEAGVGKSRLILELRAGLGDACHYLEGRCLQFGSTIPFLPVLDILRGFFEITDEDREANISDRMNERLGPLDENLLSALSAYQDLLSLAVDDPSWNALEPKEKRTRIFEAVRDLLIRYSEDRPLVLMVDDLHWMDRTSEEFLGYFIDWLAHSHILLILLRDRSAPPGYQRRVYSVGPRAREVEPGAQRTPPEPCRWKPSVYGGTHPHTSAKRVDCGERWAVHPGNRDLPCQCSGHDSGHYCRTYGPVGGPHQADHADGLGNWPGFCLSHPACHYGRAGRTQNLPA
ncbi:MAG: AAA family ATPase [Deltaproteobacteria bacterium]|nr:AAA family ATPase [Deltaproteobacteria bacterium]